VFLKKRDGKKNTGPFYLSLFLHNFKLPLFLLSLPSAKTMPSIMKHKTVKQSLSVAYSSIGGKNLEFSDVEVCIFLMVRNPILQ
jgi:hypothetical protein